MLNLRLFITQATLVALYLNGQVNCNPCTEVESVNITLGEQYPNGSVIHEGFEYKSDTWYKVDDEDGMSTIYGCPCIGRICIWKCCGHQSAFINRSCEPTDLSSVNPFNPSVYKGKELLNVSANEHFFYINKFPCDDRYLVDSASGGEELFIQKNGTLYEVAPGGEQWHTPASYCVDMMVTNGSESARLVAGVCYPDSENTVDSPILFMAYAVGLLLSVPFLLATFLVYALVPELRNLHGMCLMAYCAGLIVAYTFLAYLKLQVGQIGVTITGCLFIAFIIYYAFQTSFFWLNVMCFDIWRTFSSGYRGGSTNRRREYRRFCMYAVYAWGLPVILTACTAGMQFGDLPRSVVTPGFGTKRCWFDDWLSELVYFHTSVLILVIANVVFFAVTAHRIRSIKQETAILKGAESSRSDKLKRDKQRYALYLKLFMVMGVNWTVEWISFAVGGSNWYWIIVDLSNIMLGIFIFFIFVWKKKVRNLVHKRFRHIFGMSQTATDSRTRWTTSSAPTEDTRVSAIDDSATRLKDMH